MEKQSKAKLVAYLFTTVEHVSTVSVILLKYRADSQDIVSVDQSAP